jgi:hypothetical protein
LSQKEDGPDLLADVDALGKVQRQTNGFLEYQYYKKVFILIQKHSK